MGAFKKRHEGAGTKVLETDLMGICQHNAAKPRSESVPKTGNVSSDDKLFDCEEKRRSESASPDRSRRLGGCLSKTMGIAAMETFRISANDDLKCFLSQQTALNDQMCKNISKLDTKLNKILNKLIYCKGQPQQLESAEFLGNTNNTQMFSLQQTISDLKRQIQKVQIDVNQRNGERYFKGGSENKNNLTPQCSAEEEVMKCLKTQFGSEFKELCLDWSCNLEDLINSMLDKIRNLCNQIQNMSLKENSENQKNSSLVSQMEKLQQDLETKNCCIAAMCKEIQYLKKRRGQSDAEAFEPIKRSIVKKMSCCIKEVINNLCFDLSRDINREFDKNCCSDYFKKTILTMIGQAIKAHTLTILEVLEHQ